MTCPVHVRVQFFRIYFNLCRRLNGVARADDRLHAVFFTYLRLVRVIKMGVTHVFGVILGILGPYYKSSWE